MLSASGRKQSASAQVIGPFGPYHARGDRAGHDGVEGWSPQLWCWAAAGPVDAFGSDAAVRYDHTDAIGSEGPVTNASGTNRASTRLQAFEEHAAAVRNELRGNCSRER